MKKDIIKWADKAMFEAEPIEREEGEPVVPKVYLVQATTDPLGAVAAACRMYEGKATRHMSDITDEERKHYWEQSIATHLKAPWEFVNLHFFIEGVTRAFTHQMVRQRTAVYAQESLRFAVKDNMAEEIALPPSLMEMKPNSDAVQLYRDAVQNVENAYNALVNGHGIPAEDARHLLPHGVTTRLNYSTNLRGLVEHAGNRLCTQAQFEWRLVFAEIVKAMSRYNWQYEVIAKSAVFRPICFKMSKCPFKASFDRACTIRDRVENGQLEKIHPGEWLADHRSARERA